MESNITCSQCSQLLQPVPVVDVLAGASNLSFQLSIWTGRFPAHWWSAVFVTRLCIQNVLPNLWVYIRCMNDSLVIVCTFVSNEEGLWVKSLWIPVACVVISIVSVQECTSPGCHIPWATEFYMLAPKICKSLILELASCYPCGALNFEVASKFLENLCTPGLVN
jgi:hypothetical protein